MEETLISDLAGLFRQNGMDLGMLTSEQVEKFRGMSLIEKLEEMAACRGKSAAAGGETFQRGTLVPHDILNLRSGHSQQMLLHEVRYEGGDGEEHDHEHRRTEFGVELKTGNLTVDIAIVITHCDGCS